MTTAQPLQAIPTEKGWPLLGILPKLLSGDPYQYLKNIMLKYGDIVQVQLGPQTVYLVSHPDYLKQILVDKEHNYRKPELFYNIAREVAGNGLVTSGGDFWLRQRRMIQPHLHRKHLANLFTEMVGAISEVLDEWEPLAEKNTQVELSKRMGAITGNVITKTMFGKDVLSPAESSEAGRRVSSIIKYIGETLFSSALPNWFPIPGKKQYQEDLKAIRQTVNEIIAKSRQKNDTTSPSLINMMILSVDEETNEQMTGQQLFDEVMTIFVAGYESTASALTWMTVVFKTHPEVFEKVQAEVDQVLGGRTPSFEDIPKLVYTRQVFLETLRMYTVTPFLPRALNQADELGGYQIPAEAMVLVFYHGVHHNPKVWDEPDLFKPERFTPENDASRDIFAYVPFSVGPRKCAGNDFALMEGVLATAMILQRYKINVLPGQVFDPSIGGTMKARHGVKVTFSSKRHVSPRI